MLAQEQLKDLAERRRLLLLESELHRGVIRLECERIRQKTAGLNAMRERIKLGGPWMAAGGAIASVFALRHWRRVLKWAPTMLTTLKWVSSLRRR